ncbi:MFS transporter [Rhodococcus wratislaviensis]|uniref:Major facilitator superfamily (MFS) profile domain-containing protein n=2 Tax=Rhodococcus TaxID=1827 RepID=X0R821_RHOWR|nr:MULTISPECIES: MFS transporter [Rhodococcus]WAM19132.1 MFS transporter [Rhodococcus sp. JS3073]GAF47115.1 hypothetical protein RW1_038_00360 [Rhodococcus wratislaviensis NBRC 100605]
MSNNAQHVSGNRSTSIVTPVVLLAVFVMPISISGTAIALPAIAAELGDSPAALQWVVNGFNIPFALFTLIWGAVADRVGYKRTFALGALISLVGSALSVLASHLLILDAGRLLAGVGGAAIVTGGTALLSTTHSGAKRAKAFALLGTVVGLGLATGPTISGGLVALVGWRGVFATAGVISITAVIASVVLPADAVSVARERGKAIDFSPLRNRYFLSIALVPVAVALGYVPILTYLPVALSAVSGMDAGRAGLLMLPLTVPVLIAPALASMLVHRVQSITPMIIFNVAMAALVVGDLGLLVLGPERPVQLLVLPMLLLGFGFGLPLGLIDAEALAAVPTNKSGAAAGVLNFLRLGSEAVVVAAYAAFMTALLVAGVDNSTDAHRAAAGWDGASSAYAAAFHLVVIAMSVLTLILATLINLLHRSHRRRGGGTAQRQQLDGDPDIATVSVS